MVEDVQNSEHVRLGLSYHGTSVTLSVITKELAFERRHQIACKVLHASRVQMVEVRVEVARICQLCNREHKRQGCRLCGLSKGIEGCPGLKRWVQYCNQLHAMTVAQGLEPYHTLPRFAENDFLRWVAWRPRAELAHKILQIRKNGAEDEFTNLRTAT